MDCLEFMRTLPDNHVNLTFGSPPYEAARTYGIGFNLRGQDWVDWMVERIMEMLRITRGLVAMVVEGQTRKFRWSAAPALLMADLHRRGIHLRKPPIYHRVGIPGSGGPDWLRNDYEFIVCCTKGGKLPWSDNTACGHPPKHPSGGKLTHRDKDGRRRHLISVTSGYVDTAYHKLKDRAVTEIANPGNVVKCNVGGGQMGSKLAHDNEAPFPESLAELFVKSFCPPGGLVFDPFSGSGTTGAVAIKNGRRYLGCDIRDSQVELTTRRLSEAAKAVEHVTFEMGPYATAT